MNASGNPSDPNATRVESPPVGPSANPVPPDRVAPLTMRSDSPNQGDPFGGINCSVPRTDAIIGVFCDASARNFSPSEPLAYVANNLPPETQICADARRKRYLYHAIREVLEAAQISFFPPNMAQNSRIVYCKIGTIWPHT